MKERVNIKVTYKATLVENSKGNEFVGIPDDLKALLNTEIGSMRGISENLYPNQDFIIEIRIANLGGQ